MVEQIRRVAFELAVRLQREAPAKALRGALVQIARRRRIVAERRRPRAPSQLVRGELVAPAQRVPETGVIIARCGRALDQREPFSILLAPRNQQRRQVLQRLGV